MEALTISPVSTPTEAAALDKLLWEVLWKQVGLPRDVRKSFKVDGESLELVARVQGQIEGGLVAVWTGPGEVELRHLAVRPGTQGRGLGRELVSCLISGIAAKGCLRLHTIARHTSADFFRKMGFQKASGAIPEHPDFKSHGITFQLMEITIDPGSKAYRTVDIVGKTESWNQLVSQAQFGDQEKLTGTGKDLGKGKDQ